MLHVLLLVLENTQLQNLEFHHKINDLQTSLPNRAGRLRAFLADLMSAKRRTFIRP